MADPTVEQHFSGRSDHVRRIYDSIIEASTALGPVEQDPKKTSIHLNRRVAFAGVQTRKELLILTLKSDRDMNHRRVLKTEQTSANRWHFEVRLRAPGDVDEEVRQWIRASYELAK